MPEDSPAPIISWKKVDLTVVVIVFLTTIAALIAWFYVDNRVKNIENSASTSTSVAGSNKAATKSSTSSATVSTANWTTFSDTVGALSFKYTSGWVKVADLDNSSIAKAATGDIWLRAITFEKSVDKNMIGMIQLQVANNPNGLTVKEFYNTHQTFFSGYVLQETSDLTIGGKATLKTTYDGVQSYDQVGYVVANNQKVYLFNYSIVSDTKDTVTETEYKQIFSTITFK